jgi:hypothetical protein
MVHVAHVGDVSNSYKILVGKLKGKRPFVRPKMYLKVTGCEDMD